MLINRKKPRDINQMRINRHELLFNNREKRVIDEYCRKHKIDNKSRFMRESIMSVILQDYPTLFELENDRNLFNNRSAS
jgi:hypothetical protein